MNAKLQAHHARRNAETRDRLRAALERMRTGKTVHLAPGYKWTKKSWGEEAGVNKDTVVATNTDGGFRHADLHGEFDRLCLGGTRPPSRLKRMVAENAALRDENRLLKRQLAERGENVQRAA